MKRFWWILCAGIFICGCGNHNTAVSNQPTQDSLEQPPAAAKARRDELLKAGVVSLNKADLTQAIRSFNQAIIEFPNDPQPHLVLAEVYMRLHNYQSAIDGFQKAIRLDPGNGQAYFFMGLCYGLSGDRDTAAKALEKSIGIFKKKNDEKNFKRAVTALQQMLQAPAAVMVLHGKPVSRQ